MFSIREMDYETNEESGRAFSRIPRVVERVDDFDRELMPRGGVSTNRPWVGEYDEEKMEFRLIEPRFFLGPRFFYIVVWGRITNNDGKTTINIELRLGILTIFLFLMIYLGAVFMAVQAISAVIDYGDIGFLEGSMLWILLCPGLGTFLLYRKLNAIKKKVEDLFEL